MGLQLHTSAPSQTVDQLALVNDAHKLGGHPLHHLLFHKITNTSL